MNRKSIYFSFIVLWFISLGGSVLAESGPPASYLNASELKELYSSMYSSIHNVSFSYTEVIEDVIPDPNAPDKTNNLIRYQKVERIEEGDKFYTRYSFSTDPNGFGERYERLDEASFDGSVTMEYWPREKSGRIIPGRTGKSYETSHTLLKYMFIRKIVSENECKYRITLIMMDPHGKVRPYLERISGQWCHVVETINPPLPGEPKRSGITIWFAADKGGLPMKYEKYNGYGKCVESMVVEKVATIDDQQNKIWYPQEATMTDTYDKKTLKQRFICHELRVNIETNKDTWKISFPAGTRVVDEVSGLYYVASPAENVDTEPEVPGTHGGSMEIPPTPPTGEIKNSETNIDDEHDVSCYGREKTDLNGDAYGFVLDRQHRD